MHKFFPPAIGRWGTILAFALALWAAAAANQAIADDGTDVVCGCGCKSGFWEGCEPVPRDPWYAATDGMAMQRLFTGMGPVATLGLGSTGSIVLSHQDLNEPFQGGARVLIGHTFDGSPWQVEASYFVLSSWDTSAQTSDPTGNLYSPFTNFGSPPDTRVDENSLVSIHEVSRLESGDVNFKYLLPLAAGDPTIVLLLGVRHVAIREEFDYFSQPTLNANPVSVFAHTNNNLWGPQIGMMLDYGRPDVWLHFEGKAAICENDANRDLSANVNGVNTTQPRSSSNGTAEVADISATVLWRPTSALTLRFGYQAMWCDQLALAARNFAPNLTELTNPASNPPVEAGGHLIYHGPFAGLQLSW
jgi:hypothetical protein